MGETSFKLCGNYFRRIFHNFKTKQSQNEETSDRR